MTPPTSVNSDDVSIGEHIASIRKDASLSRSDTVRKLQHAGVEMQPTVLWRIETGKRALRATEARALAEAFNVTLDDIVFGTENRERGRQEAKSIRTRAIPIRKNLTTVIADIEDILDDLEGLSIDAEKLISSDAVKTVQAWLDDNLVELNSLQEKISSVELALRKGPHNWPKLER